MSGMIDRLIAVLKRLDDTITKFRKSVRRYQWGYVHTQVMDRSHRSKESCSCPCCVCGSNVPSPASWNVVLVQEENKFICNACLKKGTKVQAISSSSQAN